MIQPTALSQMPASIAALIEKGNAKIALMNNLQVIMMPMMHYGLLTGGEAEYKRLNKLRSSFTKNFRKGPIEDICEEVYNLAKEQMDAIAAHKYVRKSFSAEELGVFRKCIDDYKAILAR